MLIKVNALQQQRERECVRESEQRGTNTRKDLGKNILTKKMLV